MAHVGQSVSIVALFIQALLYAPKLEGQSSKPTALDSLQTLVRQAPNDTARIRALCALAKQYSDNERNDSLGRIEAVKAEKLTERLGSGQFRAVASY